MTYYFSLLYRRHESCTNQAVEVRCCVAFDAEDVQSAELHVVIANEWLWGAGGSFQIISISKLHYETLCRDLEVRGAA